MKPKINSTEYKIQKKKKYLQRLIDIPYEEWTKDDYWHNNNKPFYVTKNIIVDVVENQVVVVKVRG